MAAGLEKYVQKYRIQVIVGILVILAAPIGYGVYNNFKGQKNAEYADRVFTFSKKELKELKENTLKPSEFINHFTGLLKEISYNNSGLLVLLEAAEVMVEKNDLVSAKEILELGKSNFTSDYEKILIGLRLSAVYEDLGENNKAIDLLEDLASSKVKILEGKVNLDLGRLYKKVNNPGKAKEKFEYVLNNFDEEVYKKLAQLNLSIK
ncbi:MAG: tetratricopeptide repeat protein [Bacteriovoracales bacterium]